MTTALRRILAADHTGALGPALAALGPVTTAGDVGEVLVLARAVAPSALVVHAGFPPEGGVPLAARLAPMALPTVLVMPRPDPAGVGAALRVGVRSIVDAAASPRRLARALEAAVRGELFLGPRLLAGLTDLLDVDAAARRPFPGLSEREREILALLASGADAGRIAARLGLTPKTVRNHLARIQATLGVPDRAQAAAVARTAGLASRGRNR